MGKVEAQPLRIDQRTLLGDVCAQHSTQRRMQQMGCRVMKSGCLAFGSIHLRGYRGTASQLALLQHADVGENAFAPFLSIVNLEFQSIGPQPAGIADLTARFGVERGVI